MILTYILTYSLLYRNLKLALPSLRPYVLIVESLTVEIENVVLTNLITDLY